MLLTVDIGTTNFKSALWDYDGNLLSYSAFPMTENEESRAQWTRAFENCLEKIKSDNKNLKSVQAVVISGNGPTLVPVTGDAPNAGSPVESENPRFWLDRKALKFQEEVSRVVGGFVDAGFFLPKILRIKREEFNLYKKTKYFVGCPEYLALTLTGEARSVFPSDGFDRWFWNDDVLAKLDLDKSKFPPFIRPGEQFGTILPRVASSLGFSGNVPVISGGPDFFVSILGSGATEPSFACDRTGSSEGINLCVQKRVDDARLMSYGHPVKPYWNLSGIINTTGRAIQWFNDLFEIADFNQFISLAKESAAGAGGLVFLPYLAGERAPLWNPSISGLWRGLSLSCGKKEFASSILEGICLAVKDVISVMEETGEKVNHLRVTGGMAGISFLNQLKSDITGKPVYEPRVKNGELLGCAIIGSCFLGKYSCYKDACGELVKIEKRFEPNIKNKDFYDALFKKYLDCQKTALNFG